MNIWRRGKDQDDWSGRWWEKCMHTEMGSRGKWMGGIILKWKTQCSYQYANHPNRKLRCFSSSLCASTLAKEGKVSMGVRTVSNREI